MAKKRPVSAADHSGDHIAGYLEIGTNESNEVVMNIGKDITGHIVFSPNQAKQLAKILNKHANVAQRAKAGSP